MENTVQTTIDQSSEFMYSKEIEKFSPTSESIAVYLCKKPFAKKQLNKISCATTPLTRRRCSHDNLLKFQHKRSMCHHRRKAYELIQGQCNRLPISRRSRRFPRAILSENMLNQSNRTQFTMFNDVIVTKMWDV